MAGYIGSKAVNLSTTGADINGDANIDGDLSFRDNDKVIFGAGSDLQIYHDGSNSYIDDNGTGGLNIRAESFLALSDMSNRVYLTGTSQGAVGLRFNDAQKLATTSTGVDITGTLTSDGLTVNSGTNNTVAKFESSDAGAFIILEDSGSTNDGNRIAVEGDVMSFATGDSEAMRIDSSGNVGIGTSSPNIPLEVKGRSADGRFLRGTDNGGTDFVDIGHSGSLAFIDVTHSGGAYHDLAINTGGSEAMRILSDGSVGINDSSPDGKLNVVSTAHNNGSIFDSTGTTQLWLRDTDASSNQKNWGFQVSGGSLNIVRANDDRASGFVTPIEIQQAPANSLVINSAGDLFVGCASLPSASVKGFGIDNKSTVGMIVTATSSTSADSHHRFFNPNGDVGGISTSGSATTYSTSSDYRLKENVVYDWDATTRLKQLKPARFNFIADAETTVDGFLAHEAQAVVPEAVTGTKDEVDADGNAVMQGIDQAKLVPLLVKTIHELEARITALETN